VLESGAPLSSSLEGRYINVQYEWMNEWMNEWRYWHLYVKFTIKQFPYFLTINQQFCGIISYCRRFELVLSGSLCVTSMPSHHSTIASQELFNTQGAKRRHTRDQVTLRSILNWWMYEKAINDCLFQCSFAALMLLIASIEVDHNSTCLMESRDWVDHA